MYLVQRRRVEETVTMANVRIRFRNKCTAFIFELSSCIQYNHLLTY